MSAGARDRQLTARPWRLESLHLFVLATFAVTQPVYDRLGERPQFLLDSNVGRPAVLLLTATMSLVIPSLFPIAVWCAGRLVPRARVPVFAIALYLLLVLIALPIAKLVQYISPDWLTIGLGLFGAGLATWGYFAFGHLRSVVTAASPGILVFPVLFLFHSPVSTLFAAPEKIAAASRNPIPVVMVVLDELCGLTLQNDEHQIEAARFPHFAELARGATWYRNATTVHPDTSKSLPAMLSGKYPPSEYVPGPHDLPQNLFSLLRSTNEYEIAVFEPVSRLASKNEPVGPHQGWSSTAQVLSIVPTLARVYLVHLAPNELQPRLPPIPQLWFGLQNFDPVDRNLVRGVFQYNWGNDRRSQFEHFINCFDGSPEPCLYFFHVLLPHVPWCYLPSGRRYLNESAQYELLDFDTHSGKLNFWGPDELFVAHSQQRYLLQLEFVDSMLGRLIDRLRETGVYDKCLLVVTADHGISFKVGMQRREATAGNFADVMSIPLFIKLPLQETGAVDDTNVESIDLLPTIADALGIKLRMPVNGSSLFDNSHPERTGKTSYSPSGDRMAVPASVLDNRSVVQELRARFGSPADPVGLFRVGPRTDLLGRKSEDFVTAEAPVTELEMRRYRTRYSDDRDELVPCYFEGKVALPRSIREPLELAVAVNGVIQAVTRTYEFGGLNDQFTAMVPEQALRVGENDIQFYTISSQADGLRLTRCKLAESKTKK
jgi:hypothetical protein